MTRRFRFAMLGAAAWFAAALPASADISAAAIPIKYNLTARPGERLQRDVMVSNFGAGPVVVHVRLAD